MRNPASPMLLMLATLALVPGMASAAPEITIHLKETVLAGDVRYTLRDISEVTTADLKIKRELERIEIGLSPRIGYTGLVTRAEVSKRLEIQMPTVRGHIVWSGSDVIRVRGVGREIQAEKLVAQAGEYLATQLRQLLGDVGRIEIEKVGTVDELNVPTGTVSVVTRTAANQQLKQRMCVWLDVQVNGQVYRTIPVWFGVRAYRPVLVARQSIDVRSTVRAEDFIVEDRDVAGVSGKVARVSEDFRDLWTRRPIMIGEVVTSDSLEERPLVQSGRNVRVTIVSGPVRIDTSGVAQMDAKLGDDVTIRNMASKETFTARVVQENTVEVNGRGL